MTTTTFNQVIGDRTFTITVPVKNVERLLNRVDNLNWLGREAKAVQLLTPFIGALKVDAPSNPVTPNVMLKRAEENRSIGRYQVIKTLQAEFGISYQKARNISIKLGIE